MNTFCNQRFLFSALFLFACATSFAFCGCTGSAAPEKNAKNNSKENSGESTSEGQSGKSPDAGKQSEKPAFDKADQIVGDAKKEVDRLFKDWEKPDFALFVSGRQHGYIEPCGCTGLANQLGGMMRRHTLMTDLQTAGWNLVGIDTGNQVRRFGRQANLKLGTTYQCLGEDLKYQAVGLARTI